MLTCNMRKGSFRLHLFILFNLVALSFLVANIANADVASTSPRQMGYYCTPYTSSYTEDGYYQPYTHSWCTYININISTSSTYVYGNVFRGVVGSSTNLGGHYIGNFSPHGETEDFPSSFNFQQDEPLFTAIYAVRRSSSLDDSIKFANFFTNGSNPPPTNEYAFINW